MTGLMMLAIFWGFILMSGIVIWSLNTLFGLGIVWTFQTHIAILILTMIVGGYSFKVNR